MPSESELQRMLVLIYASNSAHDWVNYSIPVKKLEEFCQTPVAKADLVSTLRQLADDIEQRDYTPKPKIPWELQPKV